MPTEPLYHSTLMHLWWVPGHSLAVAQRRAVPEGYLPAAYRRHAELFLQELRRVRPKLLLLDYRVAYWPASVPPDLPKWLLEQLMALTVELKMQRRATVFDRFTFMVLQQPSGVAAQVPAAYFDDVGQALTYLLGPAAAGLGQELEPLLG